MKKMTLWTLAALLACLCSCEKEDGTSGANGSSDPETNVILFDDFDRGDIPDPEVWKLCEAGSSAWNRYFKNTDGYSNVRLEDGCLVLTADKADGNYRNGGIRTRKGFPVGTLVEVRARVGKARGGFPAIWQMPVGGKQWPQSGEIDLMEWIQSTPSQIYCTLHTAYKEGEPGNTSDVSSGTTWTSSTIDTQFHTYAAARERDAVKIYIDGLMVYQYRDAGLYGANAQRQFPFYFWNFDLILNYSLGGENTWPGPIDDSDLPVSMYIDWVRVTRL